MRPRSSRFVLIANAFARYSPVGSKLFVQPKLDSQPTVYVPPLATWASGPPDAEDTNTVAAAAIARTAATGTAILRFILCTCPPSPSPAGMRDLHDTASYLVRRCHICRVGK